MVSKKKERTVFMVKKVIDEAKSEDRGTDRREKYEKLGKDDEPT